MKKIKTGEQAEGIAAIFLPEENLLTFLRGPITEVLPLFQNIDVKQRVLEMFEELLETKLEFTRPEVQKVPDAGPERREFKEPLKGRVYKEDLRWDDEKFVKEKKIVRQSGLKEDEEAVDTSSRKF